MLLIALPVGLVIGLSLGALGGGGSILTVPALVYLLDQDPHSATTGSLIIVGITALSGSVAHARAGRVRVAQGLVFGILGVAGSYVGSRLSASVDPHVLLTAFAGLMVVAAGAMYRRLRASRALAVAAPPVAVTVPATDSGAGAASPPPLATAVRTDVRWWVSRRPAPKAALKVLVAATVVGLLTGFFGVGGGFVIVPALVLALGFEMPVAVGTSLLVIAVNSAASLLVRLGSDVQLDWGLMALFTGAAVIGSIAGNRVASRVNPAKLSAAFIVLILVVAAYTAARSIPFLF
jgi:uncharacterized membrane protein YfcA